MQGKQDQRNFMGSVSSWEHLSLRFASIVGCEPFPVDYWWYYLCPWCPNLTLLATFLSRSCWPCNLERLHLDLARDFMNT
jgi:hypothetical protein